MNRREQRERERIEIEIRTTLEAFRDNFRQAYVDALHPTVVVSGTRSGAFRILNVSEFADSLGIHVERTEKVPNGLDASVCSGGQTVNFSGFSQVRMLVDSTDSARKQNASVMHQIAYLARASLHGWVANFRTLEQLNQAEEWIASRVAAELLLPAERYSALLDTLGDQVSFREMAPALELTPAYLQERAYHLRKI